MSASVFISFELQGYSSALIYTTHIPFLPFRLLPILIFSLYGVTQCNLVWFEYRIQRPVTCLISDNNELLSDKHSLPTCVISFSALPISLFACLMAASASPWASAASSNAAATPSAELLTSSAKSLSQWNHSDNSKISHGWRLMDVFKPGEITRQILWSPPLLLSLSCHFSCLVKHSSTKIKLSCWRPVH